MVVEEQSAHVPAEWLLILGGLLRDRTGSSSDLGVSRALLHRCVSSCERCQSNGCCGSGDRQRRDIS
jgi:hypothetical protein